MRRAAKSLSAKSVEDRRTLYYGDNLGVLEEYIEDHSVDLIYLDPPFNSNAQYNVIFERPDGAAAEAQAGAFHDTWTWTVAESEPAYESVMKRGGKIAETLSGMMSFLGKNDIMAYLCMMAPRLVELRRVLKPTGSVFLHCDPTASHYLKLLLDAVFGPSNFRNEIIWLRSTPKGLAFTKFPASHDVLLFYAASSKTTWNSQFLPHREEYIQSHYSSVEPKTGRRFQLTSLLNPNKDRPNLRYEFPPGSGTVRVWRWTKERMHAAWKTGSVVVPEGGIARYKRYLDEQKGSPVTSVWSDIPPVNSQAQERLGYPTQKPLPLIERIIAATTNPGDVVLDPFCGCGTTIEAAQVLNRRWIGIDVTHYAITVIEERMRKKFNGLAVEVVGRPADLDGAWDLAKRSKSQFQWWANWLVGVQNYREIKGGGDQGIDGKIFFMNGPFGTGRVIVSVKGGDTLNPSMVRDLIGTVDSEKAQLGLFVCIAQPTAGMIAAANRAGIVKTAHGSFPKIQIITVQQLLAGNRPSLPPYYQVLPERSRVPKQPQSTQPQLSFKFPVRGDARGKRPANEIIYPSASLLLSDSA